MSATGEGDAPSIKLPAEPKPVKEKKPKFPEEKKPNQSKTASQPPYVQMIKEALLALNKKGGSSPYAIAKYMEEKHKSVLPANFKKILGLQLKNQVAKGMLVKIKASYKLSEAAKKEKKESTARVTSGTTEKQKQCPKRNKVATAAAAIAVALLGFLFYYFVSYFVIVNTTI